MRRKLKLTATAHVSALRQYRLLKGTMEDGPLLVPLAVQGTDMKTLIGFCREILPGAPILTLRLGQIQLSLGSEQTELHDLLQRALVSAIAQHDLVLVPIVLIGYEDGADLALRFSGTHCDLLTACILVRPGHGLFDTLTHDLVGLSVLLCGSQTGGSAVGVASQLQDALKRAGARVICETTSWTGTPGGPETELCRRFLESLFGVGE
jgi:hypothetical protein